MGLRILRRRANNILPQGRALIGTHLLPVTTFLVLVTLFNLWLLMQPMIMRM